jgi:hypothetical protein
MDYVQHPAWLPGRRRKPFHGSLHAENEVGMGTVQQSEPFMAVGDQTAQLVLIGVTLARDEMVDQLCPHPPQPARGPVWVVSCNRTAKVALAGSGSGMVRAVLPDIE